MKKFLALMMAMALSLAFVGCGSEPAPAPESEAPAESTEAPAESTEAPASSEAPAESVPAEAPSEVKVMSHEEFMAAAVDSEVVVETYVQDKQSYYAEKGTATIYAQSEDGAYFLYNAVVSAEDYEKLVPGTKIKVTGFKAEWSGEVEIVDAKVEIIEGSFIPEVLDATALLGTEELIAHQNEKVAFNGLTIADSGEGKSFLYKWDGSGNQGDDVYFKASINGETYTFVVESYLRGMDTDTYKAVEALKVGDVVDLEGFLYWYEGSQPHITTVTVK